MGRIERVSSTAPVRVKQAQLIDPGAFRFDTSEAQAIGQIGGVISELGKRKRDMQDRIGVSDANAIMEQSQLAMAEELINTPFEKRQEVRLKHTQKAMSDISQLNLSNETSAIVGNKAGIWSQNIGDLGDIEDTLEISKAADVAVSTDFQNALSKFDDGSPEVIEAEAAFDKQFANKPPEEAKAIKDSVVGQTLIFKATNNAADNPTKENMQEARDVIDKYSTDEKDRFFNLQRLRSESSKKTQNKNATFKANMNLQSETMGKAFSSGALFQGETVPELDVTKSQLTERYTNKTLDVSDNKTFKFLEDQINLGKSFEQDELTSAYATGMSSSEYEAISKLNEENSKLTLSQKDNLKNFDTYINSRYSKISQSVSPLLGALTAGPVLTAIGSAKRKLGNEVRSMVRDGKTDEEIYNVIESSFVSDTDRFYRNDSFFDFGIPESIKGIDDREERYESVMQLLKTGEKKDLNMLGDILEVWYE